MTDTPVARHAFTCSRCGASAGVVALVAGARGCEIVRTSFTSVLTLPVASHTVARYREAIERGDAAALHAMDFEVTPFFCPACEACYCGDHWLRHDVFDPDDGWHDSIRGTCPQGHERMLED